MSYLVLPKTLPIVRYRFTVEWQQKAHLPPYAGSTLRGVFGHALLKNVCICAPDVKTHAAHCPYAHIFAQPRSTQVSNSQQQTPPQPYLFETVIDGKTDFQAGEHYSFNMVLFGQTRLLLSFIISALEYAFAQGVGAGGAMAKLREVAVEHNGQWQALSVSPHIQAHVNELTLPDSYPKDLKLNHLTALRLQQRSKVVKPADMTADQLLRQTMRRVSSIAQLYWAQPLEGNFAALKEMAANVAYDNDLYWFDTKRYSNRQRTYTPLGGVMGKWQLYDVPPEFAALLHIGQWLHIGKETVFGLGAYRIQAA